MASVPAIGSGIPLVGSSSTGSATGANIGIVVTLNTAGVNTGFQNLQSQINNLSSAVQRAAVPAFTSLNTVMGVLAGGTLVELGKKFIDIAANMERMQTAMSILEGSFGAASESLDQLLTVAAKSPYSLGALTDAFLKIKTGGFEDPIKMVETLNDAVAAFGGSEQKFKNAAFAIQEIGGKGVVQMKELRRQLGDAIPSAIASMAEGLGISITKLTTEVQKGMITAQDGVNAMFKSFEEHSKGAGELFSKTFLGSIQQFNTAIDRLAITFKKSGGLDVLTASIILITNKIKELDNYLNTAEGMKKFQDGINGLVAHMPDLGKMVEAAENFVKVIGSLATAVLTAIPAEIAGPGLLAYIFFGKKGFVAAVLISQFGDIISGFLTAIASALDGLKNLIGDQATEFGVIGFMLFGKKALSVAISEIVLGISTIGVAATAAISGILAAAAVGIAAAVYASVKSTQAVSKQVGNNTLSSGVIVDPFGSGAAVPLGGEQGVTIPIPPGLDEAQTKIKSYGDTVKDVVKQVQDATKEFEGKFSQPSRMLDLTEAQQKNLDKFNAAMDQLKIRIDQLDNGGSSTLHFMEEFQLKTKGMQENLEAFKKARDEAFAAGNDDKVKFYNGEIATTEELLKGANAELGKFAALSNAQLGEKLADRLNNLKAQIEAHAPPSEKFDPAVAVAKAAEPFANYQKQLDEIRAASQGFIGDQQRMTDMTNALNAAQTDLNDTLQKATEYARRHNEEQKRDLDLSTQGKALSLNERASALLGTADYDKIATSVAHADLEYQNLLNDIQKLKTANPDNTQLQASLDALDARLQKSQDKILERAKQDADGTTELWKKVGSSMEDAFANAFDSIVHHTNSLKDVLLNFYNDITKAVEQYLAKQAMIGLFGGDGSIGSLMNGGGSGGPGLIGKAGSWLGGLLGGGGSAAGFAGAATSGFAASEAASTAAGGMSYLSLIAGAAARGGIFGGGNLKFFASGGVIGGPTMFGIAGEAGPEGILPLEKVGGKLGVNASGLGGGDNYTIQIQAVDAPSVKALFYKEADGMIAALQSRQKLRKFGRVN